MPVFLSVGSWYGSLNGGRLILQRAATLLNNDNVLEVAPVSIFRDVPPWLPISVTCHLHEADRGSSWNPGLVCYGNTENG